MDEIDEQANLEAESLIREIKRREKEKREILCEDIESEPVEQDNSDFMPARI